MLRHGQWFGLVAFQPFAGPDPQVQFKRAIDPVNPLVVPSKATNIAQMQEAQAKALGIPCFGQLHQPVRNLFILIAEQANLAVAGLAD
tara:strand:- start:5369 stop:5632 length:264 start_codon:yes stop_codon:yes gene_type:complete